MPESSPADTSDLPTEVSAGGRTALPRTTDAGDRHGLLAPAARPLPSVRPRRGTPRRCSAGPRPQPAMAVFATLHSTSADSQAACPPGSVSDTYTPRDTC